ncbi:hypothetical protein [Amphritea sp. HPY]|uniref:hypothetical protein n=1 Tax=Amphritea sp. HPY TaxID=3421652 RepID=UPI003D7C7F50
MIQVDDYCATDAAELSRHLRVSDLDYLFALSKSDPIAVLEDCFDEAEKAYTFHIDGEVVACMAFTEDNVWLQTNSLTDGRAKEVIRAGRKALSLLPERSMFTIAPRDDKRVMLLCKALGFTEQTAEYIDYEGSGIPHVALWRTL